MNSHNGALPRIGSEEAASKPCTGDKVGGLWRGHVAERTNITDPDLFLEAEANCPCQSSTPSGRWSSIG
jgi:hypothetical protein